MILLRRNAFELYEWLEEKKIDYLILASLHPTLKPGMGSIHLKQRLVHILKLAAEQAVLKGAILKVICCLVRLCLKSCSEKCNLFIHT